MTSEAPRCAARRRNRPRARARVHARPDSALMTAPMRRRRRLFPRCRSNGHHSNGHRSHGHRSNGRHGADLHREHHSRFFGYDEGREQLAFVNVFAGDYCASTSAATLAAVPGVCTPLHGTDKFFVIDWCVRHREQGACARARARAREVGACALAALVRLRAAA